MLWGYASITRLGIHMHVTMTNVGYVGCRLYRQSYAFLYVMRMLRISSLRVIQFRGIAIPNFGHPPRGSRGSPRVRQQTEYEVRGIVDQK